MKDREKHSELDETHFENVRLVIDSSHLKNGLIVWKLFILQKRKEIKWKLCCNVKPIDRECEWNFFYFLNGKNSVVIWMQENQSEIITWVETTYRQSDSYLLFSDLKYVEWKDVHQVCTKYMYLCVKWATKVVQTKIRIRNYLVGSMTAV